MLKHIRKNWDYYRLLYKINSKIYRNDFAFSIAIHIFNGNIDSPVVTILPGKKFYTLDKDVMIDISDNKFKFLLEKEKERKDKERKEQEAKRAAQEERKLQAMRDENLRRMAGMAGATGSPNATGDALRASGPSPSYGGRIIARVKPNIVFNPDDVSGNPVAEVEVRTAPDGKIMSRKLIKSSGNKAWDEAVIKALDKTDTLPRDTDGTIPTMMVLGFKPRD